MRAAFVATRVGEPDVGEERRFHELRLEQRPADAHERLVREHDGSLRHHLDVEREPHRAERVEELSREERQLVHAAQRREIPEVLVGESKSLEIRERGFDPAGYRVAAAKGGGPEVQVKRRLLLRAPLAPVAERHGELVEVGEECRAGGICKGHAVPGWHPAERSACMPTRRQPLIE
jgi:hypothetical protein